MKKDRFEEILRRASREYNSPPPTPREEMWERIESRRKAGSRIPRTGRRRTRRFVWPVLAAAAVAVLIFGIWYRYPGNREVKIAEAPVVSGKAAAASRRGLSGGGANTGLYRQVTDAFLTRADIVLTRFRTSESTDSSPEKITAWAGDLLTETRLLLDSPAAEDVELKQLLQDLELVLARMVQLGSSHYDEEQNTRERNRIQDGLNRKDVLMRVRNKSSAGGRATGV